MILARIDLPWVEHLRQERLIANVKLILQQVDCELSSFLLHLIAKLWRFKMMILIISRFLLNLRKLVLYAAQRDFDTIIFSLWSSSLLRARELPGYNRVRQEDVIVPALLE